MTTEQLLQSFTQILRDLLGEDALVLAADTARPDVPGWDSFNYINFMVAVEIKYGIKFRVAEVESFRTVGEIAQRALELLQARGA
jgi:acyl carrier protein